MLLLTACSQTNVGHRDADDVLEVKGYNTVMKTGKVLIDPVHGKETFMSYGAMTGIDATKANGVVYLHHFEDGVSVITANVNILPAPEGSSFVATIVNTREKKEIPGGTLSSIIGDARHSSKFESREDPALLKEVRVYLVKGSSRTLVAQGELKEDPSASR